MLKSVLNYKSELTRRVKFIFFLCFILLLSISTSRLVANPTVYDYIKDTSNHISKYDLLTIAPTAKVSNCKSYGFDNATHWIRYQLEAQNSQSMYWINHLSYYNVIQYYLYDITDNKFIDSAFAGTEASAKNLEWDYLSSSFQIKLKEKHKYMLLAGYRVFNGSIVLNFELVNETNFHENNIKSYIISFFLTGAALAILIISVIFYFIKRLPIYLFYSAQAYVMGLVFLQLVNQGFIFYLIHSDTETYMLVYVFGSTLFVISFLYFLVELLKTPIHPLNREKIIVNILSCLLFTTFVLGAFILNSIKFRQYLIQAQHIWFVGVLSFIVYIY
jgi:hypothetical protein